MIAENRKPDALPFSLTTDEIETAIRNFSMMDTDGDGRVNLQDFLDYKQMRKEHNVATKVSATATSIASSTIKKSQALKQSAKMKLNSMDSPMKLLPKSKKNSRSATPTRSNDEGLAFEVITSEESADHETSLSKSKPKQFSLPATPMKMIPIKSSRSTKSHKKKNVSSSEHIESASQENSHE
eukprot:TRINITY_DN25956_c0_g1_i1.p1 TRINITY_DN25956_c0_g1~~TRINITY_DN25956_c0_g1_i1.p1  ORF type:complete len:183 (+),score=37.28 TRINITY_DN25956_c0_g1_i1:17-565(+)